MRVAPLGSLRRRGVVQLAELPALRGAALRTSVVRVVLALDMSASIAGPTYSRVASVLKGIVDANQSIGLVMFSDTAYELLPPNSPPGALLQFIPFFTPVRYYGTTPIFAPTPWNMFSGGTRLAAGLAEARRSLARAHVQRGAILVASDLDDANADQQALATEVQRLRAAHIEVRIVPLFATKANLSYFAAIFGHDVFVDPSVFTHTARRHEQSIVAAEPWALLMLGFVLVLLLAGNERWNSRLAMGAAA